MDKKIRELERDSINDPASLEKLLQAKKRMGFQEIRESLNIEFTLEDYAYLSPELLQEYIEEKLSEASRKAYYDFGVTIEASCDHDDYGAGTQIQFHIQGIRLETLEELEARKQREEEQKERHKQYERERRNAYKIQRERQDEYERQQYERLKKKFEKEENFIKYMELVGEDAAASLRNYSDSYLKGWFWRKQRKLDGRTAEDLIKEGDLDTVRKLALKEL